MMQNEGKPGNDKGHIIVHLLDSRHRLWALRYVFRFTLIGK